MANASELLISADSHVIEPADLWVKNLPASFRDRAPQYAKHNFQGREGGTNPLVRPGEMAMDGVSAEILYCSLTMNQFGMTDVPLQEACFRVYNDWLIEYCSHAPDRLFGIGVIPTYNIDNAVREVHRCKDAGMRGVMIWQVPPEELSFTSLHYEKFWATAQELDMPVSLHILTGTQNPPDRTPVGEHITDSFHHGVNLKMLFAADAVSRIIGSGVLDRYPRLKIVLVENEMSWLPFAIWQWNKYASNGRKKNPLSMLPSEYFQRQVYSTFFDDPPSAWLLEKWGADNCMWSNDYPHRGSTWPKSRDFIARDLGSLPDAIRAKVLRENVIKLYNLPAIEMLAAA